jgi:molybdopterin-dependent oxidoreductase alpha subunit
MVRRRGDGGFSKISWDDALDLVAERLRGVDPLRTAFYLTSRGIPNETYYVAQKVARFLGTPHVDNSARLCHAASTGAMKGSLGYGASTGSYRDWIGADLIVFFGSNTPNNQPVTAKYLYYAKQKGTEIAVVNPYREPGLDRYWVPSVTESALFGTRLADHWYEVDTGGDLAFLNGVLKALLEIDGGVDRGFVDSVTTGFEAVEAEVRSPPWPLLEQRSGAPRERMESFARLLVERPNAIFVWSMGLTQHAHGVDTIRALCNLGLARGLLGRPHRGLTPIRGHSGVQGGAEVGAVPIADGPVLDRYAKVWGFDPPRSPGLATMSQLEAASAGEIDLFWIVGGNFLETVPGEERNRRALERPGLRIHHDIVFNSSMLVEPSDTVLLLPAATRYEIPGGVTETSTERRIIFSPEIPGPRIPGARPEWQVFTAVARRFDPERADRVHFADTAAIRAEIARAVPPYAGIEKLREKGDQLQWGGATLYADGRFGTPDGKAHFTPVRPPERGTAGADGDGDGRRFWVSTRRGKQFNSIVHEPVDPLNDAPRDAVLMSREDAGHLGLADGEPVRLRAVADGEGGGDVGGAFEGRIHLAPIKPGNLAVHWPEGMSLLPPHLVDEASGEPDYNARVAVEKVEAGGPSTRS